MSGQPLTPRQFAVLQWVADGCPDGTWPDDTHKHSARALETRGLVTVRRRNGVWHAVLRPHGRHYLDHGAYAGATPPDRTVRSVAPKRSQPGGSEAGVAREPAKRQPAPLPPARPLSPAESLIAQIQAAGGNLTLEPATEQDRVRLDAQIRAIRRFRKLPLGQQLIVDKPNWSKRVLTITALPGWMTAAPVPVPVPAQLRNPHPAVDTLRDSDRLLGVSGPSRARALRLLQALAAAATARGHTVTAPTAREDQYGNRERHPVHLRFGVRGHDVGLRVTQLDDRTDHVPTAKELAAQRRYSWTRIPKYDYTPSARLKLELPGRYEYQQSTWADGVKSRIEGKLPEILQELECRADAAERQRLADEERRRQEQIEEQRRIARATIKLNETHRAEVLNTQLAAWQQTRQLDDYLDAMDAKITQIEDPGTAAAAKEWLAWARAYAAGLNPLNGVIAMPPDPEHTYIALAPFLERSRRGIW
jgi:hypothetical protein